MDIVPHFTDASKYTPTPEVEKAVTRLGYLRATERDTIRGCRFEAGDIFNTLRFDSGPRAEYLMERYGEEEYKFFRGCAWVAYRWPKKDRTPGKSWDYFKNNLPGQPAREPSMPSYQLADDRWEGAISYVVVVNVKGKSAKVRATPEDLRRLADHLEETKPI